LLVVYPLVHSNQVIQAERILQLTQAPTVKLGYSLMRQEEPDIPAEDL